MCEKGSYRLIKNGVQRRITWCRETTARFLGKSMNKQRCFENWSDYLHCSCTEMLQLQQYSPKTPAKHAKFMNQERTEGEKKNTPIFHLRLRFFKSHRSDETAS